MPPPSTNLPFGKALDKSEQDEWKSSPPSLEVLDLRLREQFDRILVLCRSESLSFSEFEKSLRSIVFTFARLAIALFLCCRHNALKTQPRERLAGRLYMRRQVSPRVIGTFFGKVRYWRTYMHSTDRGGGYYPLDFLLELPISGFSTLFVGIMARLATKLSYAHTQCVLRFVLGWSPSTESIENAVLGLGRRTGEWFASAPKPEEDGEVLVIEIDGKCTPTATEAELLKRRGKRRPQMGAVAPLET